MIITVHAKPNSEITRIRSWVDATTVVIDLHSQPINGKANAELINFLSKQLKIAKSQIIIKRGLGGRVKHVQIPNEVNLKLLQG
jgi:uncharacterized protein (TIGR00251 family)